MNITYMQQRKRIAELEAENARFKLHLAMAEQEVTLSAADRQGQAARIKEMETQNARLMHEKRDVMFKNKILRTRPDLPAERCDFYEKVTARIAELEAERDKWKADAARWHWVRRWFRTDLQMSGKHYHGINKIIQGAGTVESVIDAAINATKESEGK